MRTSLFVLLYSLSLTVYSQDWQLKKTSEGIKVYTAIQDGSAFTSFKAEMETEEPLEKIEYVLKHMYNYKEMFPSSEVIELAKQLNDTSFIQYSLTNTPWPLDDRDGYYQMNFHKTPQGALHVKSFAVPTFGPEKDDVVIIRVSDSFWNVTPQTNGKTKVEYIVKAEPGGELPAWLVNSAATEIPYDTFINLKKVLKTIQ